MTRSTSCVHCFFDKPTGTIDTTNVTQPRRTTTSNRRTAEAAKSYEPLKVAKRYRCSRTESLSKKTSCSGHTPTWAPCRLRTALHRDPCADDTSCGPKRISPSVGSSKPDKSCTDGSSKVLVAATAAATAVDADVERETDATKRLQTCKQPDCRGLARSVLTQENCDRALMKLHVDVLDCLQQLSRPPLAEGKHWLPSVKTANATAPARGTPNAPILESPWTPQTAC